jgi:glutamate dehydrogenase
MSLEENRLEIIERLVEYIAKRLPQEEVPLVKRFVQQYYLSVSPEDLVNRSLLDLYGAVLSHWHYINQRLPGEAKVQVFNPQLERDGWQSTHTIIEISFDDVPFLVDSVSMALNVLNLNIHLIINIGNLKIIRDKSGKVLKLAEPNIDLESSHPEAVIYIEIDRQSDPTVLNNLANEIKQVLTDVNVVVEDWPHMRERASNGLEKLKEMAVKNDKRAFGEEIAFLEWVIEDHFTFLGYQEYDIVNDNNKKKYQLIVDSKLGISGIKRYYSAVCEMSGLPMVAESLLFSEEVIVVGKTNARSAVHRPTYTDFIIVKLFNDQGELTKALRFTGLYTAVAYNSSPRQIPLLRTKVNHILEKSGYLPRSHDSRALLNILETLPRDDLIQATEKELLDLSTSILHLQERKRIRLFVRHDLFGYFVSCLVFVPREKFTSALCDRMRDILLKGFGGLEVEFSTRFSESSLARIHFVVRVDPKKTLDYNLVSLETKLIETGKTWQDELRNALVEHCGEEEGNELLKRYRHAFPASYRESFAARVAIIDIEHFESLHDDHSLRMSLYRPLEESEEIIRFKLFKKGTVIPLSEVVPILENMGLKIISERPYKLSPKNGKDSYWINDYRMLYHKNKMIDTESIKDIFQEAFDNIWNGYAENDGFNRLILVAKLSWREIMILRAYAKYLWQTGFTFSQEYVEETLTTNADITVLLVELFKLRFDPEKTASDAKQLEQQQKIEKCLERISNLNEDRILRRYMQVILATIRTNYYQKGADHHAKPYFSFKLCSAKIPELPLPVPLYEIFVYSPRVEAIHLRAAKVARGGIRWSDRDEDFRTEILGLMKTQQVKNAVIVPMGAKGGFVVKKMPEGSRDQIMEEVIYCYKTLIRGLLDLSDNYKGNEILHPENVVRYDDDDPYLVVAADKGTATFSDIANAISKEYGFWLGDAFASGGETGYDHKKMGITAKGAWESVKQHFQEMGQDINHQDFTVTGIGDMSGDVFGNGLLLSKHIKLIAAFNHEHIFLDPNPSPEKSFAERERLFELPRSTWKDYNADLISSGGGIYLRSAKSIELSVEIQQALGFFQEKVVPNELIKAILKAEVDLLWNGGIGTYVKAVTETHAMVGDRTNDSVRVNGAELKCRVVGEGGNLGFTQFGRIEYAKLGGQLNTDAIDNSGGVNCSDNEVNIKILLNTVVDLGDLTEKRRNELLAEAQEEVSVLVLNNNTLQTKAISLAISQAVESIEMHGRLIKEMEKTGRLNRVLECLPGKEELIIRKTNQQGLTRPEIAVLMAYSKTLLKEAILASCLPEDDYFQDVLELSFPASLRQKFKPYMSSHRLKREIIATQMSNAVINEMGINFISRLQDETGSEPAEIVRAYTISRETYQAKALYEAINALKTTVESNIQHQMLQEVNRLIRRGARWFLQNKREALSLSHTIATFKDKITEIGEIFPKILPGYDNEIENMTQYLINAHVPKALAYQVGGMSAMYSALDIIEAAQIYQLSIDKIASVYFAVGSRLELGWFRELIKKQPVGNHWEALARATFRDDLDRLQRRLTINIIQYGTTLADSTEPVETWFYKHQLLIKRWEYFLLELKNPGDANFTVFAVALRELFGLTQASREKKN